MVKVTKMHTFPRCDGKGEILATELDPRGDQEHSCVQTVDGLQKITGIHWAQYAGDETFTLEVDSKGNRPAMAAGGIFNHVKAARTAAVGHNHGHVSKELHAHREEQHAATGSKKLGHGPAPEAAKHEKAAAARASKSTLRGRGAH
mmetsp:Transcript_41635/g.93945  ORF Transcript_41635/g.93945 Transcript_41635/m.93945 type:complete len:146 (-) Transcript_41635:290-727(-)